MRFKFFLGLMLFSIAAKAQNDTTIYFSKLGKVVNSKEVAFYYSELKTGKKDNYTLTDFALKDDKWTKLYESSIQRETDSTFSFYYASNKKRIYVRSFLKSDSGYYIRNYLNSILFEEGISKTIFPLTRTGQWKEYNTTNREIKTVAEYNNNQLITNKFGIPDGTFINDVFTNVDQLPEYEDGEIGLLNFIAKNIHYPVNARDEHITGRVVVRFVIMKDGSIQGLDFVERVHYLLDLEAIKAVNSIPTGKWKPGKIGNKEVNVLMLLPISFEVTEQSSF